MTKIIETKHISKRYVMGEEIIDALKDVIRPFGPPNDTNDAKGRLS